MYFSEIRTIKKKDHSKHSEKNQPECSYSISDNSKSKVKIVCDESSKPLTDRFFKNLKENKVKKVPFKIPDSVPSKRIALADISSKDPIPRKIIPREKMLKKPISREMTPKEAISKEVTPKEELPRKIASKEAISKKRIQRDITPSEVTPSEMPSKEEMKNEMR